MEPPSQTPRPTNDVDTQQRFDEFQREIRGEILNSRRKLVEWWLNAMGVGMTAAAGFLAAIALAAIILGYFNFQRFRQIEAEARQYVADSKEYAEEAKKTAEEARALLDRIGLQHEEMQAKVASNRPDEADRTVASVQRYPAVSPIGRAIAAAERLQRQDKFEEAIEKWRSIANVVGEEDSQLQTQAWFFIGSLRSEGKGADLEAAIDAYTKAIELNQAFIEAYINRGNAKNGLGQHQAAIADYDRAIELNQAYAIAYNNRGNAKNDLGQYQAAIADLDRAIELNQAYSAAYTNRGIAKNGLGQHQAAIADHDRAIELNQAFIAAYNNRGIAKDDLGQHQAAIADYDRAIELNQAYALAYNNRGIAKKNLGRINEAREDYQKALDLAQEAGNEKVAIIAKRNLSRLDNNEEPRPQRQ